MKKSNSNSNSNKRNEIDRIVKEHGLTEEEYEKRSEEHRRRWFNPEEDERAQDTPEMNIRMNI